MTHKTQFIAAQSISGDHRAHSLFHNVAIESVTFAHRQTAQGLSTLYGLLTNDLLTAAVVQALGPADIASNDPDLSVVPGLTIWRPQPCVERFGNGQRSNCSLFVCSGFFGAAFQSVC